MRLGSPTTTPNGIHPAWRRGRTLLAFCAVWLLTANDLALLGGGP